MSLRLLFYDHNQYYLKADFQICNFLLLQKEAPALGKPILVMRTETERPEAADAGTVKIMGVEKENIKKEVNLLLNDENEYNKMANAINPYGNGTASEKIVKILLENLCFKSQK